MKKMKKLKTLVIVSVIFFVSVAFVFAALIDTQKSTFLNDMRNYSQSVRQTNIEGVNLSQKWASRGFASGGANPITQADIDANAEYVGMTPTELTACVTSALGLTAWYDAGNRDNLAVIEP